MKDFGLTLNLKDNPEIIQKYRDYHAHAWPEVVASLKKAGILDMKIYLLGRRLFMFYTANDSFNPEIDFAKYLKLDPKCEEWENLMENLQEKVPEAKPGEKWAMMEKVFQL